MFYSEANLQDDPYFPKCKDDTFPQLMLLLPTSSLWAAKEFGIGHIPMITGGITSLTGFANQMG